MRFVRVLVALFLVGAPACGIVASDDDAKTSSGVTPQPACAGTAKAPDSAMCGADLTTCDPQHPPGLPVGACSSGDKCDVIARAECACPDEPGPRFPWSCTCVGGLWKCELLPPDGRICLNACASADAGPPVDGGSGCSRPTPPAPPGPAVVSRDAKGTGDCATKTLGEVIDAIHAANPALADITKIFDPGPLTTDGSFIYAYALPSGFAIAFKRGGGDCPAGCTENEYWYFQTDVSCTPKQVGHYHPTYGSGCVNVDGAPMWATPAPIDPKYVCGGDSTAQNISGSYTICASGNQVACSVKGGDEPTLSVTKNLEVTIKQGSDLSKGTVVVNGTGHPKIDGVPFDATFTRRRFTVTKEYSNLPAKCPDQWQLSLEVDFERIAPSKLSFFENRSIGCSDSTGGGSYCKGAISLELNP